MGVVYGQYRELEAALAQQLPANKQHKQIKDAYHASGWVPVKSVRDLNKLLVCGSNMSAILSVSSSGCNVTTTPSDYANIADS